jgi:hypothetical protein
MEEIIRSSQIWRKRALWGRKSPAASQLSVTQDGPCVIATVIRSVWSKQRTISSSTWAIRWGHSLSAPSAAFHYFFSTVDEKIKLLLASCNNHEIKTGLSEGAVMVNSAKVQARKLNQSTWILLRDGEMPRCLCVTKNIPILWATTWHSI